MLIAIAFSRVHSLNSNNTREKSKGMSLRINILIESNFSSIVGNTNVIQLG
jgi:hypothetical protein